MKKKQKDEPLLYEIRSQITESNLSDYVDILSDAMMKHAGKTLRITIRDSSPNPHRRKSNE